MFDITNVFSAFNFATFLCYLSYTHIPQLLANFNESKRQELITRLKKNEDSNLQWKYIHQLSEPAFRKIAEEELARDKTRREQETSLDEGKGKLSGSP